MGMKIWQLGVFLGAVTMFQTACSSNTGDFVSYEIWNRSFENAVEDCVLRSAMEPPVLLNKCSRIDPLPPGGHGWDHGGATSMPGTKHLIPARVRVGWRKPAREGQEMYRGDPVGPFELDIHALVPEDVRAKVRNSRTFQLEIAIGIGEEPVTLRWRLIEFSDAMRNHKEVRRGGDWQSTAARTGATT
jgi:hypothetical protein